MTYSEYEDGSNQVTLPQNFAGKGNRKSGQSAIKLSEIGPRMTLKLTKVESGLGDGDVLYHAFHSKSKIDARALKAKKQKEKMDKLKRKREQEANVDAKKQKMLNIKGWAGLRSKYEVTICQMPFGFFWCTKNEGAQILVDG